MLRVSNGSGKMLDIRSLNTNTLTNPFCQKMVKSKDKSIICTQCYSEAMLRGIRKNCVTSWQQNSDILSGGLIPDHMLPTILDAFFRFSSHGELINLIMLENFHNIALHNPHCSFALWTKRKDLINQFYGAPSYNAKPSNLILIYSNPIINRVMATPPKFFDRTFNNVSKDSAIDQNCTGQKCMDCLLCYKRNNGITTIIEAVK